MNEVCCQKYLPPGIMAVIPYADNILVAGPNSLPDFVATHMVASLQSPGVDWRKEFQAHMAAG
jgi:hypothetical protein